MIICVFHCRQYINWFRIKSSPDLKLEGIGDFVKKQLLIGPSLNLSNNSKTGSTTD